MSSLREGIKTAAFIIISGHPGLTSRQSTFLTNFIAEASGALASLEKGNSEDISIAKLLGRTCTVRNLAVKAEVTTVYQLLRCDLKDLRDATQYSRMFAKEILKAMRAAPRKEKKKEKKK